jgi:hypothetical protein
MKKKKKRKEKKRKEKKQSNPVLQSLFKQSKSV